MRASLRASRSPPPPVLPTKGTAAYCLGAIGGGRYNDTGGDRIIAACNKWQESVEVLYTTNSMWTKIWESEDIVVSTFGSKDALASTLAGAISAINMNIPEFIAQANASRQSWLRDVNSVIDDYALAGEITIGTSAFLTLLCFVPSMCEPGLLASQAVDLVGHNLFANKDLKSIENIFSHGLDTIYLSEQGKYIKGMMDLLQTTATMMNHRDPTWTYIGRMLLYYLSTAAASNVTYTAADVRMDLDRLQTAIPKLDAYVNAFSDVAFGMRTFPEIEHALLVDKYLFWSQVVLTIPGVAIILGVHIREWLNNNRAPFVDINMFELESLDDLVSLRNKLSFGTHEPWDEIQGRIQNTKFANKEIKKFQRLCGFDLVFSVKEIYHEDVSGRVFVLVKNDDLNEMLSLSKSTLEVSRESYFKDAMEKLDEHIDTLHRQRETLRYAEQSVKARVAGYVMMGILLGVQGYEFYELHETVDKLRESAKGLVATDEHMMSIVLNTIRTWQA